MANIHNTQVNLNGLLQILGKNLYSTPSVVLRELIQNAQDACQRYKIETSDEKAFQIRVNCSPEKRTLDIVDNGSGLTHSEILEFLATVGSGYTRKLRQDTDTEDMIGFFGLGFLSAYVVSNKVEFITTSYQCPESTWLFSSTSGETFSLSETTNHPIGSTVRLHIKDDFAGLTDYSVIIELIKRYCCLLDIPIYVSDSTSAVNSITPPWYLPSELSTIALKKHSLSFAEYFESQFEPICTIPIPADNELGLSGLLWVQSGSTYASSDNRNLSIFVRRMFITDEQPELLPRWAGFIGGVIESIQFNPTASRESIQTDDYFDRVREYIGDQLVLGLRRIILSEPEAWRRILSRHSQALLGAAVQDERLFEVCHKQLKVPSSQGDLTLQTIHQRSNGVVNMKVKSLSGYEEILFNAQQVPLVKGYMYAAHEFCEQYCTLKGITLNILGIQKDETSLFPATEISSNKLSKYEFIFGRPKEHLKVTEFKPSSIPLVVIDDEEVKLKDRIESDDADRRIGTAALALARLQTAKISSKIERRLYLNLANPVIENIFSLDSNQQKQVAELIRSFMESMLTTAESTAVNPFENFNQSLISLLGMNSK